MRRLFAFLLVTSVLVCNLSSAREFVRTFRLLSDSIDSEDGQKGVIRKMTKIDPIPEISEVPTVQPKRVLSNVDSDSSAYNPCKVSMLCRNGGTCKSRDYEYYCKCPPTHYGKTCEFIADPKECDKNHCMNNSTCYSIKEPKVVLNPDVLVRLNSGNQDLADFKNVTMSIKYECWCQQGFEGAFCEFSEGMRRCSEDKCNHHGIVVPFYKGSDPSEQEGLECKCRCEEGYSGEECEFISPCRDFECTNNGTCKVDSSTGAAYCECPSSVELFPSVVISGEHCEKISFDDADLCFPCQEGQSFASFLDCLENRSSISRSDLKPLWWADCEVQNQNCLADLKNDFCFNGTCEPVVSRLPLKSFLLDEKLFVLPKCHCSEGYEGNFCEREVKKECDLDCVHGSCCNLAGNDGDISCQNSSTDPIDGKLCKCEDGYKGERCEFKDPCYSNPCGEALCVQLPGDGMSEEPPFACICKTSQGVNEKSQECTSVLYDKCMREDGSPSCLNDGNCYPCSMDQIKNLQLCNDVERTRGFRCICPPGLKQPFCRENVTACDAHRCLNGGKCEEVLNSKIDYTCDCPPGYDGTFCQISLGACLQKGDSTCVNGVCVEDGNTRRGFRCRCEAGYVGFNCQLKNESTFMRG